jgi:hypothetical protein
MYATAPTTEIFVSRPRITVHESTLAATPKKGTATPTPLRTTNAETDAWARHASASNGFGDAVTGFMPCPSAGSRDES